MPYSPEGGSTVNIPVPQRRKQLRRAEQCLLPGGASTGCRAHIAGRRGAILRVSVSRGGHGVRSPPTLPALWQHLTPRGGQTD